MLQISCHCVMFFWLLQSIFLSCPSPETTDTLIDLAELDTPSPPQPPAPPSQSLNLDSTNPSAFPIPIPVLPPPPKRLAGSHGSQSSSPSHPPLDKASTALSLLDDELLSLGSTTKLWLKGSICHFGKYTWLLALSTGNKILQPAPLKLTKNMWYLVCLIRSSNSSKSVI